MSLLLLRRPGGRPASEQQGGEPSAGRKRGRGREEGGIGVEMSAWTLTRQAVRAKKKRSQVGRLGAFGAMDDEGDGRGEGDGR